MSEAIVLKTSPYSESTLIVWLLMREGGVARALAKGARRAKGQNYAAFDLYALVRADLRPAPGDRLGILRAIDLIDGRDYLRHDVRLFAVASFAMEVLGAVAGASHEEPYFFNEASAYLKLLEKAVAPGSLTALLLIRLLYHAGHPPRLGPAIDPAHLPERLAYVAEDCEIVDAVGTGGKRCHPISAALAERIAPIVTRDRPPRLDAAFNAGAVEGPQLLRWLGRVWQDHLGQPLKSAEFLEKMGMG